MNSKNIVEKSQAEESMKEVREIAPNEGSSSPIPDVLHLLELPDSILLYIFSYLPFTSIGTISQACKRLNEISYDEILWHSLFLQYYKLSSGTSVPSKAESWRSEFKRLYYHTPSVLTEQRKEHVDEVIHISFSHNGTMFATSSKDCVFKVWNCTSPVSLLFERDMKITPAWTYIRFSQFNENDTRLMVSSQHKYEWSGEISVFSLQDEFCIVHRIRIEPPTAFGTWYDNDHILCCTLNRTGHGYPVSIIQLHKVSAESRESQDLYHFKNVSSGYVQLLQVAEIDENEDVAESCKGKDDLEVSDFGATAQTGNSNDANRANLLPTSLHKNKNANNLTGPGPKDFTEKLLIFAYGTDNYTSHKIGFKRVKLGDFNKGEENPMDKPDCSIETHSTIVGLSLSPDHKYLYANCRPWPANYNITDPWEAPPLGETMEIITVDLRTFTLTGRVFGSHKAYTSQEECFSLFLGVCDDYITSGAEDNQGHLWDLHYGIPIYRFSHDSVVSIVAINPRQEMVVTASDDYTFKVWISRCKARDQRVACINL